MTARGRGHLPTWRSLTSRVLVPALAAVAGVATALLGAPPAGAAAYSGDQWGLGVIGAPTAWQYGNGAGVRIGIVDTGVDPSQQDLAGKIVAQGYFVSNPTSSACEASAPRDNPAADDNGHGTHVAGIAAASGAVGVSGVAPGAMLVVAKVLDCKGAGNANDIAAGINWAVANGARVINLSLGDATVAGINSTQLEGSSYGSALQQAWSAGAIPVVAAGNSGGGLFGLGNENYSGYPAVVVAATGSPYNNPPETYQKACYSNTIETGNAQWGIAAPGGDNVTNGCPSPSTPTCGQYDRYEILSTFWTAQNATSCYATDEGTSMAAPFVSGALALLLGRGLSASQAVQTLLSTANHSVACGSVCSGLLNVAAAMQAVSAPPHPAPVAAAPAAAPVTHVATAPAPSHSGSTSTSAAPTSTSPPSTTSTSAARRAAELGLHGRAAKATGGSPWWLVVPILVGLAAASALGVAGRRRLAWQRAHTQPSGQDHVP